MDIISPQQILEGMLLISTSDFNHLPFILDGTHEVPIKSAFYFIATGRMPMIKSDLEEEKVCQTYDAFLNTLRSVIERIFTAAAAEQRREILAELRTHNLPHPEGTVAELAVKYDVSKSEIRRQKAAGTLAEFLECKRQQLSLDKQSLPL